MPVVSLGSFESFVMTDVHFKVILVTQTFREKKNNKAVSFSTKFKRLG